MFKSGIYTFTSPSGKQYIGSAINLWGRRKNHKSLLKKGKHKNRPLQSAWNKYGEGELKFSILLICAPKDLLFYEQRAIDILKPEYNICKIAGSKLGIKNSKETLLKMSLVAKGRKPSQSAIDGVRRTNTGKKSSIETRAKQSASMLGNKNALGHKQTAEHIRKSTSHFIGRKRPLEEINKWLATRRANGWFSEEGLEKIALSNKKQRGRRHITDGNIEAMLKQGECMPDGWRYGRLKSPVSKAIQQSRTEEACLKRSISQKGRVKTQDHRDKIASSLKGRVVPTLVRDKIRNTMCASGNATDRMMKIVIGSKWINNGESNSRLIKDKELPRGWVYGRIKKNGY